MFNGVNVRVAIIKQSDHILHISDLTKFKKDYPNLKQECSVDIILEEITTENLK